MNIRVGLLPFYVKLYDEVAPEMRREIESFYETIAQELESLGGEVVRTGLCRVEDEFSQALKQFEEAEVHAAVVFHLAYSPSLESIGPLEKTVLPLIILDTTPEYSFGSKQKSDKILFNHGIHGVQDLCSMLKRKQKQFFIEAGHWKQSDVLKRVIDRARAAGAAAAMKQSRIGIIGEPFKGMGDFQVDPKILEETIGVKTIVYPQDSVVDELSDEEFAQEVSYLESIGDAAEIPEATLRYNLAVARHLRNWMKSEQLNGFTCNFLNITRSSAIKRMPFLYSAEGMYEGYGYAGEGDVLTASLVAALMELSSSTSFCEMFCPDWEGGTIFLSHMGEINPRVCSPRAVFQVKDYRFSDAEQPVYAVGQFMPGDAHLVNLVPTAGDAYRLIIAPVEVVSHDNTDFSDTVHGWIRPKMDIAVFLERFSEAGGTHHSALIYNQQMKVLRTFGEIMGWDVEIIE